MPAPLNTFAYSVLINLQRRIHDHTRQIAKDMGHDDGEPDGSLWVTDYNYLAIAPIRHGLHVEYFGDCSCEEPWEWTLQCLAQQEVANDIESLAFSGPDEGANGMREVNLTYLAEANISFPKLRSLFIRPTAPSDHNLSQVRRDDEPFKDGGIIARLAEKMPYLVELTLPNAPDATFFDVPLPHLWTLRIGGAVDTQNFIENMANSSNMPKLGTLDFTESSELQSRWADKRAPSSITPFAVFEHFLRSRACDSLHTLCLRNTALNVAELQALKALRPKLQLMVIQATRGGYVSHFEKNYFPWKHLVQPDPGLR